MITKGEYIGSYKYDNERMQKIIAHEKTLFHVSITEFDGIEFSGSIEDDIHSGGTPGIGTITGQLNGEKMSFVKQMPVRAMITRDGRMITQNKKHRKIFYEGSVINDKIAGTWELRFGIRFLWLFPVIFARSTGTWEMKKK